MNSKSTFYLAVLALGLFAFIYFFERHTLDTEQQGLQAAKLFPRFDPARTSGIDIIRSNGVIRVERTNGQWRLLDPVYPAQSTAVESWLALFNSLNRRAYISAEELSSQPGGAAAFGLEDPQVTVVIQQGEDRLRLRLGAKTPIGEKLYLKQVGSAGIYVTESTLLDRLPSSAADWRDPLFLKLGGVKFDRLTVRAGVAREFSVERSADGRLWRLATPRSARADSSLVELLLQQLQNAHVGQFVNDRPGSDLEPYGLQSPEVTLAFAQGTQVGLTVDFGKTATNNPAFVYARRSNYPMIVTVPGAVVERLRAPYSDFLDKRLVEFSAEEADRIEVRAAETFAVEKQANGGWLIVEPATAPADPALVQGCLNQLNSLQIIDTVKEVVTDLDPDLPKYGLSPPARVYTVRSRLSTNGPLARIDFGTTNQTDRVYVRRGDEKSVYTTRQKESLRLPQAAFELRDRRIWSFTTNQVSAVTITVRGRTYRLQRTNGRWTFTGASQGIVNTFALEEAVFRFGQLWSMAWIARGTIDPAGYGFANPPDQLAIDVVSGDKMQTLTVKFGARSASGGPFAMVELEGAPTVFECPFRIYDAFSEVVRSLTASVGAAP
jgi:hypothetical protein